MTESPSTVLIVDDDAIVRQAIGGFLTSDGYRLVFAADGRQALAQAAAASPDMILLGVMLPGMDGFEVCRRLRADPAQAEVPIVLVTALDDRASRLAGLRAGADDFLSKPLDSAELRVRVQNITRFNRYRLLLQERARFEKVLQVKNRQLHELSRRLLEVQEAERRSLAVELHDEVGQALTGLRLILEKAARTEEPEPARQAGLAQAQALLQELSERVRNLSLELRPAILDDFGLFAALAWLFERFRRQTRIAVRHNLDPLDERRFPRPVETAAFRIVQEALTNVARHAGVGEAEVAVTVTEALVQVEVHDRGRGFDLGQWEAGEQATGGLSGMRERADLLGGSLTLVAQPGGGTTVTARFPLAPPTQP